MNSILEFFPSHLTPRKEQRDALLQVEALWDQFDVFVLNLPVSVGKSAIGVTIAKWQEAQRKRTSILTPSNILVKQYLQEYPSLHSIHKRESYSCHSLLNQASCSDFFSSKKFYCKGCPYKRDLAKNSFTPISVVNYYTYLAYKMFRDVLIVDEAHQLRSLVSDQLSHKLWKSLYKYPYNLRTYADVKKWVSEHPKLETDKKLKLLEKELNSPVPKYLIEQGAELLRGKKEELLKVVPVDTSSYGGLMWPSKVRKLVLMSATISSTDVEQLGLAKRRVFTINSGSPIPADRRPVLFNQKRATSVSYQSTEDDYEYLASQILQILDEHPNQKGFIHMTYSLMKIMRPLLESKNSRLMFHTREDKMYKYTQYRADTTDKVLVACGLYEGVDLLEDMGRFQIITKVPWPSLAEPAVRWQAETNPSSYAWEATKVVIQATGRICRSPTDYGSTIILDSSFKRLYKQNEEQFPPWFKEGLILS